MSDELDPCFYCLDGRAQANEDVTECEACGRELKGKRLALKLRDLRKDGRMLAEFALGHDKLPERYPRIYEAAKRVLKEE